MLYLPFHSLLIHVHNFSNYPRINKMAIQCSPRASFRLRLL